MGEQFQKRNENLKIDSYKLIKYISIDYYILWVLFSLKKNPRNPQPIVETDEPNSVGNFARYCLNGISQTRLHHHIEYTCL